MTYTCCSIRYLCTSWKGPLISKKKLLSMSVASYMSRVKQSHYRLGQTLRIPGGWGSQISRQSAHEGVKVVTPTHRPPLTPREIFLVLIFVRHWTNPRVTVRPEGLFQWKIPVTPSGIEPATFRLVAQCVNQLHHRVPLNYTDTHRKSSWKSLGVRSKRINYTGHSRRLNSQIFHPLRMRGVDISRESS